MNSYIVNKNELDVKCWLVELTYSFASQVTRSKEKFESTAALEVRMSLIDGAGLGLFAVQGIKKDVIIAEMVCLIV